MKLSNNQIEILKLLFEAGGENVPTIANSLFPNSGFAKKEDFLDYLDDELQKLHQYGLIAFMYHLANTQTSWRYLTSEELLAASPPSKCLDWDESARCWHWNTKECGGEMVVVVIEDSGRKLLIDEYQL